MKLMEFRDVERSNPAEVVRYLEGLLHSMEKEITGKNFDVYKEEFDNAFEIAQMNIQRSSNDLSTRGERREGGMMKPSEPEPTREPMGNRFAENNKGKTEKEIIAERRARRQLKENAITTERMQQLAGLK